MEKDITHIATKNAIQDCKEKGLLTDFWNSLTPDDIDKIADEFEITFTLEREREKGREDGREKVALNALAEGLSIDLVSKITMLDIKKVRELSRTISIQQKKEYKNG